MTDQERKAKMDAASPFPDSPCSCYANPAHCVCPRDERALRNIYSRTWPHGPMTSDQREFCIREAVDAGEGAYRRSDLEGMPDRDLAHDTLNAWTDYARSQGLL